MHTDEPEYDLHDPLSPTRVRPGLVYVKSGLIVVISYFPFWKEDGTVGIIEDVEVDLTDYLPPVTGFHRLALLGVDKATGEPTVRTIAAIPITDTYQNSHYASFQFEGIDPLMYFDLGYGDTQITFQKMRNARIFGSSPTNVSGAGGIVTTGSGGTGTDLSLTGPGFLHQASPSANVTL